MANQDQTALRVVRLHERFSPLEQVYRRYGRCVAAVILRLEGRQAEVEDLVQEVFLEATRGIDGFGGGNNHTRTCLPNAPANCTISGTDFANGFSLTW